MYDDDHQKLMHNISRSHSTWVTKSRALWTTGAGADDEVVILKLGRKGCYNDSDNDKTRDLAPYKDNM